MSLPDGLAYFTVPRIQLKPPLKRKRFSREESQLVKQVAEKYLYMDEADENFLSLREKYDDRYKEWWWHEIAKEIPGRTATVCDTLTNCAQIRN